MRTHLMLSALAIGAATFVASTAHAEEKFALHLDLGMSQPLNDPQDTLYQTGIDMHVRPMFNLKPWLQVGPQVQASYFPKTVDDGSNAGVLWQFGGAVRLQRSHDLFGHDGDADLMKSGAWSPYINLDLSAAHTGNLWRPAVDAQVGMDVTTDRNHSFWFGPYLGYEHIFQTDNHQDGLTLDSHDVNLLTAGISGTFDFPPRTRTRVVYHREVDVVPVRVVERVTVTQTVAVKEPDTFELKQHVYFDFDKSVLRWESKDKLDEVVAKIKSHPGTKIHVQGHASPDGQKAHNEKLAAARAESVRKYLVDHGVDASQLTVDNFGIDRPVGNQKVLEGRERSRRVEFEITVTSSK